MDVAMWKLAAKHGIMHYMTQGLLKQMHTLTCASGCRGRNERHSTLAGTFLICYFGHIT